MRTLLLAAVAVVAMGSAGFAQGHSHGDKKGPRGGAIQDVVGIEAELVQAERGVTIYLYDEAGTPVRAAGYSGSALVGSGASRQVVQLVPGAENVLSGTAGAAIPRGAGLTLQLKAPGGKTGQAKF